MSNRFVFVVPCYNASETLARMLHSVCGQSYDNWKLVLIDDVSNAQERRACESVLYNFDKLGGLGRFVEIWNDEKRWEVANVLEGLKHCEPDDIVCRLDADDWLTDLDALTIIDAAYQETGCDALWTAHRWGYSDKNISGPMPEGADPYRFPWVTSHLKTFRRNLLDGVAVENFLGSDGRFIRRAGDQAIYLPVLKRAKKRVFLPRVVYHYAIQDVPATYQTDDARYQRDEAEFIRARGFIEQGTPWSASTS